MSYAPRFSSLAVFAALLLAPALAFSAQTTVSMTTGNAFSPQSVSVAQGDTVTWMNQSNGVQSATADSGLFDSGSMQVGQQFSVTFNQPGIYKYHSAQNGGINGVGMSGSVLVNANTSGGTYVNPNANYYGAQNSSASAPSIASLTAQVQSLLAQIQALQGGSSLGAGSGSAQVGSIPYNTSQCPQIGRSLHLGASGDDVSRLQQFLARDSAIYPGGQVTGYFGALTQAAVQRWQAKYNVVSSGSPETTGYGVVGPRTAAAISLLCSTGSVNGVSGPAGGAGTGTGAAPVGGLMQVTPVSGAAPLNVSVTATVNTGLSCAGATYTLDFGDGTVPQQIIAPPGNCSQQSQVYQHTYIYGGTYQIVLSAQGHQSTAQVVVSGTTAPAGAGQIGAARGTMTAFSTSGKAPFSTTFYVSCAAGTAYNVVFGDGTDLGGSAVSGTKCGTGSLDAVSHAYQQAGNFQAQLIIFSQQSNGTVAPTTAATVNISVGTVATNYAYNPPQLTSSGSALGFTVQFDLPTACAAYDIDWGDSTTHTSQGDGGTSCAQTSVVVSKSHTYASAGSYTLTLKRGPSLARTDTIAVTVTQ